MAANGVSARSGGFGQAQIGGRYVVRLKQWSVSCSASESAWGDSDSVGFTNRKKARKDCTGSLTGVQDNNTALASQIIKIVAGPTWATAQTDLAGRVTSLALFETAQLAAGNEYKWYFPSAIIQNFNITYDMDTKEVVEWTLDFAADGVFYRPGESGASGAGDPTTISV